ncbi:MAG: methyltransferase domain-containing protein [Planctomycetota bacterium]|nr:methyltransferase domain-containing protein [Planctomycetota bacterium]
MNESPVPALICPSCRGTLIDAGHWSATSNAGEVITCPGCRLEIPVRSGIPRFVQSQHLESFGRQWNRFEVAHDDEDRATFQAKTGVPLAELKGLSGLDAGCGGGRYSRVAGEAGAKVWGADHSHAVDKAAALCGVLSEVRFVQADLKRLPFPERSFDFVFSIGVMHHDVDTRAVFDAVAKLVRPGGRYSVWLYRRGTLVRMGGLVGRSANRQPYTQQNREF